MNIIIPQRLTVAKHLNDSLLCDLNFLGSLLPKPLLEMAHNRIHLQYLKDTKENETISSTQHIGLYELCQEVQHKLHYELPIHFLFRECATVSCSSFSSPAGQDASVIIINAGAAEQLSEDELRWRIGHCLGHIINRDAELMCLYDTFCTHLETILSTEMKRNMRYYELLADLEADRYGLLACGSIDTAISSMEQLMSAYPMRTEALKVYAQATNDYILRRQLKPILINIVNYVKHS